jgi:hypothetical protein
LITHVRSNAIAYVALFFAIGGGGAGAAIAATVVSTNTIHACVSKTNGALYVAKRCTSAERALSFDQRGPAGPAGSAASLPYGQVDGQGQVTAEKGMTIVETATGMYTVTITATVCKKANDQIPVITPVGFGAEVGPGYQPPAGSSNVEPAITESSYGHGFRVAAGYLQADGTFVPTPQGFNLLDECGNYSS